MRTKKPLIAMIAAVGLIGAWYSFTGSSQQTTSEIVIKRQGTSHSTTTSQRSPVSVTDAEHNIPSTSSTENKIQQDDFATDPVASQEEHHEAQHQSGIPHECLESIRLGAEGQLPKVVLDESELESMKQQEEVFEEKMAEEFEQFIVSDDGQTLLDKEAITADFQAEVDAMDQLPEAEVEAVFVESL